MNGNLRAGYLHEREALAFRAAPAAFRQRNGLRKQLMSLITTADAHARRGHSRKGFGAEQLVFDAVRGG
jgi:hypothetical protein